MQRSNNVIPPASTNAFGQCCVISLSREPNPAANIIAFILIWIAVPCCLALFGEMISTVLDKLFVLGKLNSFLGSLMGLLKYELILGAFIWVFSLTQILSPATMEESVLCRPLKAVAETVYSLLIGSEE